MRIERGILFYVFTLTLKKEEEEEEVQPIAH